MFFFKSKNNEEVKKVEDERENKDITKVDNEPNERTKRDIANRMAEKFLNMDLNEENVNKIYEYCTTTFEGRSVKSILELTLEDEKNIEDNIEELGITEDEAISDYFKAKRMENNIIYAEIFGNSIDIYSINSEANNTIEAIRFLYGQLYVTHHQMYLFEINNVAYKDMGIGRPVVWTNNPQIIEKFIFLGQIAKVFSDTRIIEQDGKRIQACFLDKKLNHIIYPQFSKQTVEWIRNNIPGR